MKRNITNLTMSEQQLKYYDAILWLTNPMGPRGSGRTYLLALSFITHSLKYKTWISIYDHESHTYAKQDLIRQITTIVNNIKSLKYQIRNDQYTTEILVKPIENYIYNNIIEP